MNVRLYKFLKYGILESNLSANVFLKQSLKQYKEVE